ncbi:MULTISPECIES: hypothetical protein [Bacillaceae]|uniref:UPF0738 family protein n=1 Tax=Bacillaceae TaxID=186817 RepID=UPI001C578A28|nr:hypothetical protein [Rossellomorea sp. YZS02]MBW3114147.1 hypothetical protein [Bacillus sp. MCCB 382]MDX8345706.1 hypothetical protein [Rossellomorea sp. YZS02]
MRKIVQIQHTTYENGTLHLHTDQEELIQGTTAAGQIIADSDRYAFVYLVENAEEYVYLYLEESIWPELKKALHENAEVVVKSENTSLELDRFVEELDYLVGNIEGNGNYGDEMVKKVENVFLEK